MHAPGVFPMQKDIVQDRLRFLYNPLQKQVDQAVAYDPAAGPEAGPEALLFDCRMRLDFHMTTRFLC